MHVMFIHPNFPAQFGTIAAHLATDRGWRCTFVTSIDTSHLERPFQRVTYRLREGPLPRTFYSTHTLQEHLEHLTAVYYGLRTAPSLQPDLVVGHMSFGTMLYLRNLYRCPFVGYFEILPAPFWTEQLTLRPEFPPTEDARLAAGTGPAITYLHLHAVEAAYTPTHFQLGTAPAELRHKIRVIFDGVDMEFYRRRPAPRPATVRGRTLGPNTRVVTYVSRGLESVRGFDIFMKVAKRIYQRFADVVFLVAGEERTHYGHELGHIGNRTFKEHVLAQEQYDLDRFLFLGQIPRDDLVTLFSLSDLHFYLTAPWTLSWSLVQAMSTGCTVLGSATAPVQEVIDPGVHGLLADFYDVDGLAEQAVRVLRDPGQYRPLGEAARQRVLERYELKRCTSELVQLFEGVAGSSRREGS